MVDEEIVTVINKWFSAKRLCVLSVVVVATSDEI